MNKNVFDNENLEYTANSHMCDFDAEFGIKNPTIETNQISRIVKQVKRDKQKKRDDELWEEHCEQQNIVVSITGSYVVKDKNYPSILLPKNTSHDSLFQSGAITIISNENLQEDLSYTDTSCHSYTDNSLLKTIDENDKEVNQDDEDFIMKLNEANVQNSRNADDASTDDVQNNKDNNDTGHDDSNLNNESHFLTSREIAVSTKLWLLRNKINTSLDAIVELWEFEPILDGEEDLARRHKRAAEFESRFSRNYLYNLSRQMGEIHKLMKNYSPRFIEKNSSQTIFQKISNAHTLIFQGLSAYQKHLASSIPGGVPEKLNDLLAHACDLWRVCNKCEILKPILYSPGRNEVYIEDIDEKCKKLLQNIRSDQENKMKLEQKPSCTSTITITPKKSPKKIDKKNRLSMYTLETPYILKHQRAFWKKSLNHLSKPKHIRSKKKPNSPEDKSKNKMELTVNYLNPSMSQESFPMKHKKSEIICEPPKEDEIITQMDILNQRESGVNNSIEPVIKKSEENVGSEMSKEQFNESLRPLLLEILQNIDNKENLEDEKNSMMELKNVLTEIKQVTVKNNSDTDITPKLSLQKKRSKTTITGPKNAKLICLSPVESENDEDVNSIVSTPPPCQTVATSTSDAEIQKECIDSPTQTSSLNVTRNVNSMLKKPSPRTNFVSPRNDVITKTVKFQKPRPKIMKINMPKSIIRNLTKYKDLYANHTRKNSMYVIKKNRKPWEILSKIADTLLDSMISDVVSELEIDNLLLKLYEMEFH